MLKWLKIFSTQIKTRKTHLFLQNNILTPVLSEKLKVFSQIECGSPCFRASNLWHAQNFKPVLLSSSKKSQLNFHRSFCTSPSPTLRSQPQINNPKSNDSIDKWRTGVVLLLLSGGALVWPWKDNPAAEPSVATEKALKHALEEAYAIQYPEKQCDILSKLAEYHLQLKNYSGAAKLLNGAIAICQMHQQAIPNHVNLEKDLLDELKQIEVRFVEEQLQIPYHPGSIEAYGINPIHKERLIELRNIVKERLKAFSEVSSIHDENTSKNLQQLSKFITQQTSILLEQMLHDCISMMQQKPPCQYALVGTGSLAREEMTPYSDLECFMLIAEDKQRYKHYFQQLSQLLELKIINLGETDLVKGESLLPLGMLNPTQKGLSLDVHKTPNNRKHPQIGTPIQIAQYQLPEYYVNDATNHLSGALLNTVFITGTEQGKDLLINYQKEMSKILQTIDVITQKSLGITRALSSLKDDVNRFEPKLELENEGQLLQVKEDFYRLPHTIIDALALYQGLKSSSTWDRIDELCAMQFMSIDAGRRLKQVLSQANEWRLKTYSYYNEQREVIDILARFSITASASPNHQSSHRGLSEVDIKILTEAYKILIPLYQCAGYFYKTGGIQNLFIDDPLYDNTYLTAGNIASRLCQYTDAKRLLELGLKQEIDEVALTGQDPENVARMALFYNRLGTTLQVLGDANKAVEYHEKGLSIWIKMYGLEHPNVAMSYNNLGMALQALGDANKAVEYHEKALSTSIKVYGLEHPKVAVGYNNLGATLQALGDANKAVEYHEKALSILIKVYGLEHPNVAIVYNNLGVALQALGDAKKAVEYHEKALSISIKVYGLEHPNVAIRYCNLGATLQALGNAKKAVEYHEKALSIWIKMYGLEHPKVAVGYNNLGATLQILGDAKKAVECHEKALSIWIKVYGLEHPKVAVGYDNLGKALQALGDAKKAVEYHEKALSIWIKVYGLEHPNVAVGYNDLGATLQTLGDTKKAVEYHEKALSIWIKAYGLEHLNVAVGYNNLGKAMQTLGDAKKAVEYHEKALAIDTKIYGPEHPKVVILYNNLGTVWRALGNANKAVEYYEKALAISIKIYDPGHSQVVAIRSNLNDALAILGKQEENKKSRRPNF